MVFTVGVLLLVLVAVALRVLPANFENMAQLPFFIENPNLWIYCLSPIMLFVLLIFVDASIRCRSMVIGFLAVEASFVQLFGYGLGFLKAWWERCVLGKGEFAAYEDNFYE